MTNKEIMKILIDKARKEGLMFWAGRNVYGEPRWFTADEIIEKMKSDTRPFTSDPSCYMLVASDTRVCTIKNKIAVLEAELGEAEMQAEEAVKEKRI